MIQIPKYLQVKHDSDDLPQQIWSIYSIPRLRFEMGQISHIRPRAPVWESKTLPNV